MVDTDETTTEEEAVELELAVETFLSKSEAVFDEYDDGYLDPDAALSRLGDYVGELRDAHEGE